MAKQNSKQRKKSLFYEEKSLVGLILIKKDINFTTKFFVNVVDHDGRGLLVELRPRCQVDPREVVVPRHAIPHGLLRHQPDRTNP
jgi:hypothetical protein